MRRASCGHLLCSGRRCGFDGSPLLVREVAPRNWMRPLIAVAVGVMLGLLLSSCSPSQAKINRMVDARLREVAGMVQTDKPLRVEIVNPVDCSRKAYAIRSTGSSASGSESLDVDGPDSVTLIAYADDALVHADGSTATHVVIAFGLDDAPDTIDALIGRLTDLRARQRNERSK